MNNKKGTVCVVSPFPPPFGGMAVQAEKIASHLECEGFQVRRVRTNREIPPKLGIISKIPGLRTLANLFLFLTDLRKGLQQSDTVYFLTAFFNFFFWVTYPALILIQLCRKRVIVSARGGEAGRFFEKYKYLIRPVIRRVDLITTPSGFLQDAFRRHFGIEPLIIPNIADLHQFQYRKRETFRPRILVARNFEKIYDVAGAVRAFQIVHHRFPNAALGLVGDGSLRKELTELVSSLNLKDSVHFYGSIRHEQMQEIYNRYDISLNASRVDNLPGAILEAFACGLPVVSTNAGGIPYIVENGKTGLLKEIGDFRGLADGIIRIIENPELGRSLAASGFDSCRIYSWDHVRSHLLPLLTSA